MEPSSLTLEALPRALDAYPGPVEVILGSRGSSGSVQAHPGAFLAHPGVMEAHPGPLEVYLLAGKAHLEP